MRRGKRTKLKTVDRLKLFRERAQELDKLRLVQSQSRMGFRLKWDKESGLRSEVDEPDEEDLRSFLLLFQKFISKSEPVFVPRVFNDYLRYLTDEQLKEEVRKAKDGWESILRGRFGIIIDGTSLTPEYVFDLWINGFYFHDEPDKAAELERLLGSDLSLTRAQLLMAIPGLVHVIQFLGAVVARALDEELFDIPPDAE